MVRLGGAVEAGVVDLVLGVDDAPAVRTGQDPEAPVFRRGVVECNPRRRERERSRVGMKYSSWCHAWPGLPSAFTNNIDCIAFTSGPTTTVRTSTTRGWSRRSCIGCDNLWGKWMHRTVRSTSSSGTPGAEVHDAGVHVSGRHGVKGQNSPHNRDGPKAILTHRSPAASPTGPEGPDAAAAGSTPSRAEWLKKRTNKRNRLDGQPTQVAIAEEGVVPTRRLDALLVATALGSTRLIAGATTSSGAVSNQMTPPVGEQLAELAPRGAPAYDWFGNSVAVSGNTIVVGARAVAGAVPRVSAVRTYSPRPPPVGTRPANWLALAAWPMNGSWGRGSPSRAPPSWSGLSTTPRRPAERTFSQKAQRAGTRWPNWWALTR